MSSKNKNKPETPKRRCTYCDKALVPIGHARNNGSLRYSDWKDRQMHKKCYQRNKEEQELRERLKRYI